MQVRRNPFAREEMERLCLANEECRAACAWCGQRPKRLFTYEPVSDGGRRFGASRPFCNLECWESYQ